jgi:hypothetical protein
MSAPVAILIAGLSRDDVARMLVESIGLEFPTVAWPRSRLVGFRTVTTITAAGVVTALEPIYADGAT